MANANYIINRAMTMIGLGTAGDGAERDDAGDLLDCLNDFIDTIKIDSSIAYTTNEIVAAIPIGAMMMTIGPGGDFDTVRPASGLRAGCFTRIYSGSTYLDYSIIPANQDEFNAISLKKLATLVPSVYYYGASVPLATIQLYPQTTQAAELHLIVDVPFSKFDDLTTEYVFPDGYQSMFIANLAVLAAPMFSKEASPTIHKLAANTLKNVLNMNVYVPKLENNIQGGGGLSAKSRFIGGM